MRQQITDVQKESKNLHKSQQKATSNFDELFNATKAVNLEVETMIKSINALDNVLQQTTTAYNETEAVSSRLNVLMQNDKEI